MVRYALLCAGQDVEWWEVEMVEEEDGEDESSASQEKV